MSQRGAQASVAMIEAAPAALDRSVLLLSGPSTDTNVHALTGAESRAGVIPPGQLELLAQAQRQGLLHSNPLPNNRDGETGGSFSAAENDPPVSPSSPGRQFLSRLLRGQMQPLEPLCAGTIPIEDTALDSAQREAVARALHTPDICLIQGLPGTGKSRVVAEIVTQAVGQGKRVLLLALIRAAAIDRVLELTATRDVLSPIRCVDRDEHVESLPPFSRLSTYTERVRRIRNDWLERARKNVTVTQERSSRRRQDETVWPRLEELADRLHELDEQLQGLADRRLEIPEEVDRAAVAAETDGSTSSGLASLIQASIRARDESRQRADSAQQAARSRLEENQRQRGVLTDQLDELRLLAEAKKQKRWWAAAWWRALFHGKIMDRITEAEACGAKVITNLDAARQEIEQLERVREEASSTYGSERHRTIAAEIAQRQAELDQSEAALRQTQAKLEGQWRNICLELDAETVQPSAMTRSALASARLTWQQQLQQEEARMAFAQQWAAYLEDNVEAVPLRLQDHVNLVAATTTGLTGDEHFGDAAGRAVHFDLLVVEEADEMHEAEFLKAARRADRWVLVGEPHHSSPTTHDSPLATQRPSTDGQEPGFFELLWQNLRFDPRSLPYAWVEEGKRLCCRLRAVSGDERRWVERERLADFPEIELRILTTPRSQPMLVEVVFPPSMTVPQATAFIFNELQELPVCALGSSLRWVEEPDRIALRVIDTTLAGALPVVLEPGIRALIGRAIPENVRRLSEPSSNGDSAGPAPWYTCSVEFERSAGWDRRRAEEWVRKHAGVIDLNRTVCLDVPYRMQPGLATFLSDLLFDGAYQLNHSVGPARRLCADCQALARVDDGQLVQFVPVPPLQVITDRQHARNNRRGLTPATGRTVRGGAGLELDLANPRHREQLPIELRSRLPKQGLVNFQEAQAVTRAVKSVLAGLIRLEDAKGCRSGDGCSSPRRPGIAVLALYPAQAELIRCLLDGCADMASSGIDVEIGVPETLRQRESLVTLVSMTRSHVHRAVSFGDSPRTLALALTRACGRLILFGDPGTLVRRSQWQAPLDHLDETAAARECMLISRLVQYLQGQGPHKKVFHVQQVSNT